MRAISNREAKQRGCEYCLHSKKVGQLAGRIKMDLQAEKQKQYEMRRKGYLVDKARKGLCCPYARCPYREMDNFTDYNKDIGGSSKIKDVIKEMFKGNDDKEVV